MLINQVDVIVHNQDAKMLVKKMVYINVKLITNVVHAKCRRILKSKKT